jgi:hypothetical protein
MRYRHRGGERPFRREARPRPQVGAYRHGSPDGDAQRHRGGAHDLEGTAGDAHPLLVELFRRGLCARRLAHRARRRGLWLRAQVRLRRAAEAGAAFDLRREPVRDRPRDPRRAAEEPRPDERLHRFRIRDPRRHRAWPDRPGDRPPAQPVAATSWTSTSRPARTARMRASTCAPAPSPPRSCGNC